MGVHYGPCCTGCRFAPGPKCRRISVARFHERGVALWLWCGCNMTRVAFKIAYYTVNLLYSVQYRVKHDHPCRAFDSRFKRFFLLGRIYTVYTVFYTAGVSRVLVLL